MQESNQMPSANLIPMRHNVHHWIIEEPNGTTSIGRCKGCGVQKTFSNYLPDVPTTNTEARERY